MEPCIKCGVPPTIKTERGGFLKMDTRQYLECPKCKKRSESCSFKVHGAMRYLELTWDMKNVRKNK